MLSHLSTVVAISTLVHSITEFPVLTTLIMVYCSVSGWLLSDYIKNLEENGLYLRKSFLPRHSEFRFVDLEVSLTDFLAGNFVHHTDSADTLLY
jgi:hypothetical protein